MVVVVVMVVRLMVDLFYEAKVLMVLGLEMFKWVETWCPILLPFGGVNKILCFYVSFR